MPFPAFKALDFDSLVDQAESAVLRTEMESGHAKQAQKYTQAVFTRSLSYVFTSAQYAAFKTWWNDDIGLGSGWFDWDDPLDGATKTVMMKNGVFAAVPIDLGAGSEPDWQISFQLDIRGI